MNVVYKLKTLAISALQGIYIYIILFLIALYFSYPYLRPELIIASGESVLPLNPAHQNVLFTWSTLRNLGSFFASQSTFVISSLIWPVLELGKNISHPSGWLLFLSFYLPSVTFFIMLKNIFPAKYKIYYLPSCLLYSFNVFRLTVTYQNEVTSTLFISLPLFFLFYYKLLHEQKIKYIFSLLILSFLASSLGNNFGMFFLPIGVMVLYYLYYIFAERPQSIKKITFLTVLLLILLIIVNGFWLYPLITSLLTIYLATGGPGWAATNAGTFSEHIRFLGAWFWKSGYGNQLYIPYAYSYDNILLLASTYLISIVSIYPLLVHKKFLESKKILVFISCLFLLSIFLSAGEKGPFKLVYRGLYNFIPLFKIYREPFARFTSLVVFSLSVSLFLFIKNAFEKLNSIIAESVAILLFSTVVLINVFPLFTHEAIKITHWNQYQAGSALVIPAYWKEAIEYINTNIHDSRITLFPYITYVSAYNLQTGITLVGSLPYYLLPNNEFNLCWAIDSSRSGKLTQSICNSAFTDAKYLGFLGSSYILQQNDIEWRYDKNVLSPSKSNALIQNMGFSVSKEFGKFTLDYLKTILNEESDTTKKNELYVESLDKPILTLYKVDPKYYVPKFYIPTYHVSSISSVEMMPALMKIQDFNIRTLYNIFNKETYVQKNNIPVNEVISFGELKVPVPKTNWNNSWIYPNASIAPSKPEYFLVKVKEALLSIKTFDTQTKIDTLIWLSSKRIVEVFNFKLSGEALDQNSKSYLETNKKIHALFDRLPYDNTSEKQKFWSIFDKYLLYFQRGVLALEKTTLKDEFPDTWKDINSFYTQLLEWESARRYTPCKTPCYLFPVAEDGEYEVLVGENGTWRKVNEENIKLTKDSEFIYNYDTANINLNIEDVKFDKDRVSYLQRIDNWKPRTNYKISLDYKIVDSNFEITILEDLPDYGLAGKNLNKVNWSMISSKDFPTKRVQLYNNKFTSSICFTSQESCQQNFETVVKSSENVSSAYIYISLPLTWSPKSHVSLDRLTIKNATQPLVAIRKVDTEKTYTVPPSIEFERINPTKYLVKVSNANFPYTLVFNESFHKNWKVYSTDSSKGTWVKDSFIEKAYVWLSNQFQFDKRVHAGTKEYFNGDIKETIYNGYSYDFLDAMFSSKTTIADDSHAVGNGYANTWYITPADTNNMQEYTLIIEFATQKNFLITLLITISVVTISVIYLLVYKLYNIRLIRRK